MVVQVRPDEIINIIRGDVQMRYEPNFAFKSACSTYLALPGLRGFWSMSSVAYTDPQCLDISANGLHLTNDNVALFAGTNLIPFALLASASSERLYHVDGGAANAFDIRGTEAYIRGASRGLTAYAWVYFDNAATANEYILSKWLSTGNQRGYTMLRTAAGTLGAYISTDGIASVTTTTTGTMSATTWYFVAMQYDPSTELSAWLGSSSGLEEGALAAGIPASIFDNTSDFELGAVNSGGLGFMDGRLSLVALCAAYHTDAVIKAVFEQTRAMFGV